MHNHIQKQEKEKMESNIEIQARGKNGKTIIKIN